ncbi:hypothetical protein [Streptosporangium sp. NPDC023615]
MVAAGIGVTTLVQELEVAQADGHGLVGAFHGGEEPANSRWR